MDKHPFYVNSFKTRNIATINLIKEEEEFEELTQKR